MTPAESIAAGDEEAWASFYAAHFRKVRAVDVLRVRKRRPVAEDVEAFEIVASGVDLDGWLDARDAVAKIDPGDRLLLAAAYVDGRSGRDLATDLGILEATAKTRLYRVRQNAKERIACS